MPAVVEQPKGEGPFIMDGCRDDAGSVSHEPDRESEREAFQMKILLWGRPSMEVVVGGSTAFRYLRKNKKYISDLVGKCRWRTRVHPWIILNK